MRAVKVSFNIFFKRKNEKERKREEGEKGNRTKLYVYVL